MILKILKLKSILFKVYGTKKYRDQRVNSVELHQSRPIEFHFRDGNSFSSTPPLLKMLVIVLLSRCKCEEEFEIVQKIEMIRGKRPRNVTTFLDRNEKTKSHRKFYLSENVASSSRRAGKYSLNEKIAKRNR